VKRVLGLAVVAVVVGVWGGIRAWQSASIASEIQTWSAIVIGCNLALCLWLWYRARPGSGDAMVVPGIALLSGSMLVGILPRLFWPAAGGIHMAGSIASIILTTGVVIMQIRQIRRWRSLRRSARPV
jgi:hypothetical protein